ncbi:MAG TPA: TIGR03960 family B12-binding radical SAM protein [Planctomycetaceae bacterium]|nr:TIGR03960 family B12-binding radical SAM protein [Planctomycetaceae bacterium]HIQ20292.1 TIGR03960 family B12-binding radical SAM protein [Planctomycetota bacterium]
MLNQSLKDQVVRKLLPRVQTPGQYIGGEWNAVVKDRRRVRGRLCLAFPDTYAIGMSHHGLQVLYSIMNARDDWACERAFTPWPDMERLLRAEEIPLYSLETFTPLADFDVVGFSLQHELGYTNVLTMLELGGIPLSADARSLAHPLVIAGGPCAHNPEPMSRFIDVFLIGDGEEVLPALCDAWLEARRRAVGRAGSLEQIARRVPHTYVPRCYEEVFEPRTGLWAVQPRLEAIPEPISPAVVADLDAVPLPAAPVVPLVECVQDRLAIEIMRGCPWRCRFCQSSPTKRPLRFRRVDTVLQAAWEAYRRTGYNEISLLSLSASDYPHFDELVRRMQERFRPLGVNIAVPSLRVNEQLKAVSQLVTTDRRSGLTLAPEAARESMRRQIGKAISDGDLFEGCRQAFQRGFQRVKLYFMCGLPGEEEADLRGIIEMAEAISRLGRQLTGRPASVVANVSNFVPKPHTPYQWHGMRERRYFEEAQRYLRRRRRMRSVELKCHDIDASLLEGLLARGDRRLGAVIQRAWQRGARLDAWNEHFRPELWQQAFQEEQVDSSAILHHAHPLDARLPWDHIGIRQGRGYLEHEHRRSLDELPATQPSGPDHHPTRPTAPPR